MSELEALLAEAAEVTKPSMDGLGRVAEAAQKLRKLEARANALLAEAALIAEQIKLITEKDIPALFDEYHLKEFTTDDGRKLAVKPIYIGKILPEDRAVAYQWLETNGYGGLVKTSVEAQFAMGELDKAKALQNLLIDKGYMVNAEQTVHPQTLGKFVKTLSIAGKDIPSMFNPNILRRAKFS